MVRWRMAQLRHRYEERTGRALTATDLLREAGLSTSIAYLVMADEPKRIGLKSIGRPQLQTGFLEETRFVARPNRSILPKKKPSSLDKVKTVSSTK